MSTPAAKVTSSGWQARLELGFAPRAGRTALVHRSQRGPLAVQRPFYPEDDACHLYLLHPPGGVVGGDSLHIQAEVDSGARALVTTPGATKFYLSAGDCAEQVQQLGVASDASLEWLPQENIFFPGAIGKLNTHIEISEGARFIGWEINCLGLPVTHTPFDLGQLEFQLQVDRNEKPLLRERLVVDAERLHGAAGLRGVPVSATLLATPAGQEELEQARAHIGDLCAGATLLDDMLVVRYLGDSTEQCRKLFIAIWAGLRHAVIGRVPCPPRIWFT